MSRTRLTLALALALAFQSACASHEFRAEPITLTDQLGPDGAYAGIRLLGAVRLNDAQVDNLQVCGLSGLAWDEDASLLYAISDKGAVFHLRPQFDSMGTLTGMRLVAAYPLRDPRGRPLEPPFSDSEGLAIRNGENGVATDAELLVSFEGKPRIVRYSPDGRWQGEETLPPVLRDTRNYRSPNEELESVAIDARWGVLTGSETPLRGDPQGQIRIFAANGRSWNYPLGDAPGSALVAMEALPDGSLLTLERAFVAPLRPLVISLRRTELTDAATRLKVDDVAILDSSQGWLLDNFEGLTRYRDRRFFMVSDDNCSAWQSTLVVQFELLPTHSPAILH